MPAELSIAYTDGSVHQRKAMFIGRQYESPSLVLYEHLCDHYPSRTSVIESDAVRYRAPIAFLHC